MKEFRDGPLADEMMGEAWPAVQPGADPVLYGYAELRPNDPVEVRSLQTFELVYTVGRYGLDDTGSIRISFRSLGDWGGLQMDDPAGYNYVTARSSKGVPIRLSYVSHGAPRPRWKALTAHVMGGFLREGDSIHITFGDTSGGSPGMRMQTMVEMDFQFRVLADVCAVGHHVPIPESPAISVVPGPPVCWRAVLPSLRRPGETFQFGLKAEDVWGNPTDRASGRFTLECTMPVSGLPAEVDYPLGRKSVCFEGLSVSEPGILRIVVRGDDGAVAAESHPLVVRDGPFGGYWGDLHGQSGESIGITTARQYFDFARNKSFLDATAHQANDFQVNNTFWEHVNQLTAEHHQDGRFVTFPGYEWSGNTAVGGDRNVYFRREGRAIHRSSHALLTDRSDLDTDAPNANRLFEMLADEDCFIYAHVGGRYADIAYAHDPRREAAMEIHSAWGTFEWLLTDGFPLGHRSGVVCNSDGHKGRPGASYPGASTFGAYGGLTCFYATELSRDGIMDAVQRRHTYGTTGTRMHLDIRARFPTGGNLFERDPHAFEGEAPQPVGEIMMGDIAQTDDKAVTLSLEVVTQSPIERIEVRNGTQVFRTLRPHSAEAPGSRIRVLWSGAEYRGRGRETNWKGRARFQHASILRMEPINAWNKERLLEQRGRDTVVFDAITTGNFGGFDAWLEETPDSMFHLTSNLGALDHPLSEIGLEDWIMEAGGLERRIRVFRLPDELSCREFSTELEVPLSAKGDNPIWVSVFTEDGFQAWSSPMFLYREDDWPR